MAAHAHLKNEFKEDEKCHNLMRWLNLFSDYHKSTVKSMALMDHTKINFDLVLELMSWLITEDHKDLGVRSFNVEMLQRL